MVIRKLRQDLHTLVGAYALDALPEEDLRRFEEHLAHCEPCTQEVRGLAETSALLGSAAAESPPEGMRQRVLAEVEHTRQLAPAEVVFVPSRSWSWWQRSVAIVAAACLLGVLVLGVVAFRTSRQLDELQYRQQAVAEVLAAPDAERVSGQPEAGVSAAVVYSDSLGELVFTSSGLEPQPGKDYQLWLANPDGVRSGGLVQTAAEGPSVPLPASQGDETGAIAVTVEPEGGSEQPTTDPIMQIPLEG